MLTPSELSDIRRRLCCLVPKPGVAMPSCHEKTLCDCEVLKLFDHIAELTMQRDGWAFFVKKHFPGVEIPVDFEIALNRNIIELHNQMSKFEIERDEWKAHFETMASSRDKWIRECMDLETECDRYQSALLEYANHAEESGWHNLAEEIRARAAIIEVKNEHPT